MDWAFQAGHAGSIPVIRSSSSWMFFKIPCDLTPVSSPKRPVLLIERRRKPVSHGHRSAGDLRRPGVLPSGCVRARAVHARQAGNGSRELRMRACRQSRRPPVRRCRVHTAPLGAPRRHRARCAWTGIRLPARSANGPGSVRHWPDLCTSAQAGSPLFPHSLRCGQEGALAGSAPS